MRSQELFMNPAFSGVLLLWRPQMAIAMFLAVTLTDAFQTMCISACAAILSKICWERRGRDIVKAVGAVLAETGGVRELLSQAHAEESVESDVDWNLLCHAASF